MPETATAKTAPVTVPVELIEALAAVRRAVRDQGPAPAEHRAVLRRHRAEWPTLWNALDRLIIVGDLAEKMAPRPIVRTVRGGGLTQPQVEALLILNRGSIVQLIGETRGPGRSSLIYVDGVGGAIRRPVLEDLSSRGLIAFHEASKTYTITPEGRAMIGDRR